MVTYLSEEVLKFSLFAFSRIFPPWSKPTNPVYFETVSPIILVALSTIRIVWEISVLLWTIAIINFNRALENLRTKDYFSFILTFILIEWWDALRNAPVIAAFVKRFQTISFQKFLLINFTSTRSNWLNNFSFTHFLLIKGCEKYSLRKKSVIAHFVEWFKTARKSSSWILLVLKAIFSTISFFLTFGW